jgi:hypothetical protein
VLDSAVSLMMATYQKDPTFEGGKSLALESGKATIFAEKVGGTGRRVEIAAEYHGLKRKIEVRLYVKPGESVRLLDWQPLLGAS